MYDAKNEKTWQVDPLEVARCLKTVARYLGPAIAAEFDKRMPLQQKQTRRILSMDFWMIPIWSNEQHTVYLTPIATWVTFILLLLKHS
jgi:hypothetical protein